MMKVIADIRLYEDFYTFMPNFDIALSNVALFEQRVVVFVLYTKEALMMLLLH
jgi:hypothetical protein